MKKIVATLFLSIVMVTLVIPAVAIAQDDDAALLEIIEAVRIGWLEADGTPFREHFLDFEGARYFEGGGQNTGLTDLIEHHVEPEADAFENFSLDFSNIETHIENGFAWALVDTEIKATIKRDGRVIHNKGRGTYLFRNVDGEWKVVHTGSASRPVKKEEHKH
jgi:ketosteroid isomerase-like protein